jgi:hypothetical protein
MRWHAYEKLGFYFTMILCSDLFVVFVPVGCLLQYSVNETRVWCFAAYMLL